MVGVGGQYWQNTRAAERAKAAREMLDAANEAAGSSKLQERAPDKAAEHRAAVLRASGVDKIAIPAERLNEFAQSQNDDPNEVIRALGVADEFEDALALGGDVEVSAEAFAAHILGTDGYVALADHIRMEADGLTSAEADEWEATGYQEEIDRIAGDMESFADPIQAEAAQIQAEVEAQLRAIGEAPETAQYGAILAAQRYATRSVRTGISPLGLWRRDNVKIVGDDQRQAVDDLSITLDKARSTDAESFLGLSRTPMLDELKRRGGVNPKSALAGELRAMGVTAKTNPGLFKRTGIGAADNIPQSEMPFLSDEQASEDSYIPEDTVIEAVRDELAGNPRRSADEAGAIETFSADVDNLRAILDAAGLTLDSPEADIRAAYEGAMGPSFEQPAYHGTPHSFDNFSLDAIGTGEGARLYGWGLYFADKREVAEFYRKTLARQAYESGTPEWLALSRVAIYRRRPDPRATAITALEKEARDGLESENSIEVDHAKIALAAVELLKDPNFSVDRGRVYKVEIPDDGEYLLWNEPLDSQPAAISSLVGGILEKAIEGDSVLLDGPLDSFERGTMTGEGAYRILENALGSDRAASEALAAAGVPGIKYLDRISRRSGNGSSNYVIFDDKLISVVEYEQQNRGSIRFGVDATVIRMGANADRSTFLHESGHLFLEQLRSDAAEFGETAPQLVDDWNAVRDWWASRAPEIRREAMDYARRANDTEALEALSNATDDQVRSGLRNGDLSDPYIGRAMHEQWARGTEDYFRTGQAPSVALQEAFNRFRAWLVSIYSALRRRLGAEQLDVEFSPSVRAVMDRLLATDEEIALVEEQYDLKALFGSAEEIGMTPKQFEAYQRTAARASEEARTRQLKKHLNQVERATREWWRDESAKMRTEVETEIWQRPVYRALYGLARGTLPNGDDLPGGLRPSRLSRNAVVAVLENEESLARLPKVRGKAIYTTSKKEGGAHPDVIAQMYGFEDGRAMLMEMMNAPALDQAVTSLTEQRMLDKYGDMLRDGTAIDEAIESAHADKRGEVLALELNALRDSKDKMKPAFVRQWAKERIGARRVDDIQPQKFLAAEKKAGRDAGKLLRSGDRIGAQRAKFRQLLNFFMAKEAYRVREEVKKQREYLARFVNPKSKFAGIDADYVDQIRGILEAFNLAPRLSDAKRAKLMEWATQEAEDGTILTIPPEIAAADGRTHYRDLTLDEWRTLVDTVKNIEAQGRLKKTTLIDGEERAIDEMAGEIVERLDSLPRNKRSARKAVDQNPGGFDRSLGKLAGFDASLRKVEFLLEKIDGGRGGPAWRYIFKVFADAEHARNDLTKSVTRTIMDALENLPKEVRSGLSKKIAVPLLGGRTFRRSDLLMMALNVGNESNYQKMLDGSAKDVTEGAAPWTEEGVDEALSHLTAAEWEFVQTVWDTFESMYPKVEAIYRRENGVAPEKVEARQIETKHGQTLRGGYFPMIYDPARSIQARDIEGKTALEAMQSSVVKASVYSGMTKARTGFSAPVLLDIETLPNHIEKTAHYITHYEAVRATRRLISRRDLVNGIVNTLGREYYDTLKNWMNELAANGQPTNPTDATGRIVEAMRKNATVAIMGFSYTTMAAQLLGYTNAVDGLSRGSDGRYRPHQGAKWLAQGMAQYLRNPADVKRKVFAASGEMRHRLENTDREVRHSLRRLSGKKDAWSGFQRFSLMGIAGAQLYMVDFPTWLGAYNRSVSEGATDAEAVSEADSVLRTSQTAGGLKDLAAIQRIPGVPKALTMFYSFFSLLYNLQAQALGNVKGVRDVPQLAARAFILLVLPTALEAIMRREEPDEDDEENYASWLALRATFYSLSSLPLIRDMLGMAEGFGYSLSPLDSFGDSLGRSYREIAKAVDEGEMDAATLKAIASAIGFGFGAPVTQVNRIIDAADAMHEGEDVGVYDFLVGPEKDK